MAKFDLNEDLVRRLAQLLEETRLDEIEYESEGRRIRVARSGNPAPSAAPTAPSAAKAPEAPAPVSVGQSADALPPGAITAPMVGTAYVSPEPTASPFVKVGDEVHEGQTLLIIEAMKVMNQIPSPRNGTVTEILVQDAQPVEYGELLMVIS
jgi:acetyl-CoA carboxylase biotin carboxyl carrier protein